MRKTRMILFRVVIIILCLNLTLASCNNSQKHNFAMYNEMTSSQNTIDFLIINSESLMNAVQSLAIWKQQRGLTTTIVTVENIYEHYSGRDQAEKVRNCIKDFHEQLNVQWILLAGDQNHIPIRMVKINDYSVVCDQYYAILDDNWFWNNDGSVSAVDSFEWDAEVYIGRLPAENATQMVELVKRQLTYEKNPPVGSWMTHALFGGAYSNFNLTQDGQIFPAFDANRVHNWIRNDVLPSNWNSTLLGEAEGIKPSSYYYNAPFNENNLIAGVNNGSSIVMLDAHGTTTGMTRIVFLKDNNNDSLFDWGIDERGSYPIVNTNSNFDTGGKNAFFILNACNTGNFELNGDCVAEHILRNCGIGVIASSRSAHYEHDWDERGHGGWYSQGLSSRFWEQVLIERVNQPGKAFIEAKLDYVQDYLSLNGKNEDENRTLFQYNLLGDPEILIWINIPLQLHSEISEGSNGSPVLLSKAEEKIISNVMVTISNSTYYWKKATNSEGELTLPISQSELQNVTLTLSKNNYLPYQEISGTEFTSFNYPLSHLSKKTSYFFPIVPLLIIFFLTKFVRKSKRKKT